MPRLLCSILNYCKLLYSHGTDTWIQGIMYLDNTMIPTVLLNPHQFAHIGSGCQSSGACTWLTSLTSELLSDRRLSLGELHPEVGVLQLEEESGDGGETHISDIASQML